MSIDIHKWTESPDIEKGGFVFLCFSSSLYVIAEEAEKWISVIFRVLAENM